MENEGDILKKLKILQNISARFESPKGLEGIFKHPELNKKIGKVGLKGLQTALQIYFFTKGGGALINKMSSVPRLLKGALPFSLSTLGTIGTQFGIEKLNDKTYKEALNQALIDGGTDLTFSIGGLGMKELFLNHLNKIPSSSKFTKEFEKKEEDVIERYWPYIKTSIEQEASSLRKQMYKKILGIVQTQQNEGKDLNYTSKHLKNDIIRMNNQDVQLKKIENLLKKMNKTKGEEL